MHNDMECVLLHGWGVSNTIWQGFGESLSGFKNISMPCLYETAIKSKNNKFESMAEVLNESIDTDAVIIAWSVGGLVATTLAGLSKKIKAIVFIASPPCFVNKKDWVHVIDNKAIAALQNKLSKDAKSSLKYFAGLISFGDVSIKETNKTIRNNLADEKHNEILFSWLSQMQQTDQRKEFSKLNLPMQTILGKSDSLINSKIENEIKILNSNLAVEVITNCGHAPFISKQQATLKIINGFVNARFN